MRSQNGEPLSVPALDPETSQEPHSGRMSCMGKTPIFEGSRSAFCFQKLFEEINNRAPRNAYIKRALQISSYSVPFSLVIFLLAMAKLGAMIWVGYENANEPTQSGSVLQWISCSSFLDHIAATGMEEWAE